MFFIQVQLTYSEDLSLYGLQIFTHREQFNFCLNCIHSTDEDGFSP